MPKLHEIASAIKSQNAGATHYTFDIIFETHEVYDRVRTSGTISAANIAKLYSVSVDDVRIFDYSPALSLVVTITRPVLNGNPEDTDIDGAQQHVPLMMLDIP